MRRKNIQEVQWKVRYVLQAFLIPRNILLLVSFSMLRGELNVMEDEDNGRPDRVGV